ncbi:2-dehydro-3-deoxygalactonokinase [Sphingomonas sp. AR_OL41]|uniref:2-dehydro-3-deoxygalactonokinase n=1 Tax=Sphingomonas sp. AR_OL41 TaxID=3042729 RepID=UPI002480D780|nr:2-dehydro-3-deoxygalactonokinase [Sphingomonas sp. AR_OL41]MDH7971943.1 2-dehydro-3-deoxygalactonokinase [Sphingomonas sp. AR_OL41]
MTAFPGSFIAVDWGTTNRRVFRIENGTVVATSRDGQGVTSLAPDTYPAEIAAIRARFGDLPILLAGMVGSTIGWREVPYVTAPAGFAALAEGLGWIDARTAIVPGVSLLTDSHADVMRGEEVQLLGAVAAGMAPADSLLCQPGTHCKWVRMAGGEIADFTTAMTGELFALLRGHGLLAAQLTADVTPGSAFREGVEAGKARDLAASLFGIRAAKLLGRRDDTDAASYASGLLIGSDVAARAGASGDVHVLADPALGELYAIAIAANGGAAHIVDSHAAFVAGIITLGQHIT